MEDLSLAPSRPRPSTTPGRVPSPTARAELREALGALVSFPGDPDHDRRRTAWNLAADQHPFAVVRPTSADDVVTAVRAATAVGLRIAPQSTGHGAGALIDADLSDTVLFTMDLLRGAHVDPETRTAHVLGGSLWTDVLQQTTQYGLTAPHGSSDLVSVAGYSLQGGLSFYARRHGLAVNHVLGVDLVTARGELVHASLDENPDLFWAVRGGAGTFGVVTALDIDLLDYTDVHAGMLVWDGSRASEVAQAWARWTREVPESVTTSMRIFQLPPVPDVPPLFAGRTALVIDGAILEDEAGADSLLAPLRALSPAEDTFAPIPAIDLPPVHMDPPDPVPALNAHTILGSLPPEAVDAFVEGALAARTTISELRHIGGAARRPSETPGAVSAIDGDYLMGVIAMLPDPSMAPAVAPVVDAQVGAMSPWSTGAAALTFYDGGADRASGFGASIRRLREVRSRIDPDGALVGSHPLDGPLNSAP